MKKSIITFSITLSCLLLTAACATKGEHHNASHANTKADSTAIAYACPMHPDVTGKEGDICSKCNMKLEAVKSADTSKHQH
jgi:hypothetical protein